MIVFSDVAPKPDRCRLAVDGPDAALSAELQQCPEKIQTLGAETTWRQAQSDLKNLLISTGIAMLLRVTDWSRRAPSEPAGSNAASKARANLDQRRRNLVWRQNEIHIA